MNRKTGKIGKEKLKFFPIFPFFLFKKTEPDRFEPRIEANLNTEK